MFEYQNVSRFHKRFFSANNYTTRRRDIDRLSSSIPCVDHDWFQPDNVRAINGKWAEKKNRLF